MSVHVSAVRPLLIGCQVKAMQMVLEMFKMAGYIPDKLHR